jgi:hypothetical protein
MSDYSYTNGFLEQNKDGRYEGNLCIDGVDLSPIEGMFFQEEGHTYLWLKRKPILEYDMESQSYKTRHSEPRWETYLQKQKDGVVAYKGECTFLHFKYEMEIFFCVRAEDILDEGKERPDGKEFKDFLLLYLKKIENQYGTKPHVVINGIDVENMYDLIFGFETYFQKQGYRVWEKYKVRAYETSMSRLLSED